MNLASFQFGGNYWPDAVADFVSKTEVLNWLGVLGYDTRNADGSLTVPALLRLIYQHYNTALDPTNLIDNVALSETNGIRYYDQGAKLNYLNWLAAATSVDQLNLQNFGAGITPPTTLLYLMLRRALILELSAAAVSWFSGMGVDYSPVMAATAAYNIRPGGTLTKWEVMKATVGTAAPSNPQKALAVGDYLLGPGRGESAAAWLNTMQAAIGELAPKPTARLERCFSEHLDTLTYRLDSWQTGLFHVRLQTLRGNQVTPPPAFTRQPPASTIVNQQPDKGLYLGDLWMGRERPARATTTVVPQGAVPATLSKPANNQPVYQYAGQHGGFVHAPSINHASAAAVLRSGYLSHATSANPGTMSVNLSSERVRRALTVLEGIREGQTVEALLGFQFESGLHDRANADNSLLKLNDYIFEFQDRLPDPAKTRLCSNKAGRHSKPYPPPTW